MSALRRFGLVTALLFLATPACQGGAAGESPTAEGDAELDRRLDLALRTGSDHCRRTAEILFEACGHEVLDDFLVATARCVNVSDGDAREECLDDARDERAEARGVCREQRAWRGEGCALLGGARYDPPWDPARFDDPRNPGRPNPWFPLAVGNRWEFHGEGEVNVLDVLDQTKDAAGVSCLVVRDIVEQEGDLVEATDDWFAVARDGDVWYCGEEVKDYQSFDGDDPRRPELVSIDGSFKAGRDGAKAGVIFLAEPAAGRVYLEEFSLGNAEDVTEILSASYRWGDSSDLDRDVPEALAAHLCDGDCVVTRNFSLLEPGIDARKYYAPGIGFFLEVKPDGQASRLTGCNFDVRCAGLPPP